MKKSFLQKLSLLVAMIVLVTTVISSNNLKVEAAQTRTKTISIYDESELTLLKGGYLTLKAKVTPANSTDYLRFVSSDSSVVKVNTYTGRLQALKPGKATVTVIAKATKTTKNGDKANVKSSVVVHVVNNYASTNAGVAKLASLPGSGTIKLSTKKDVKVTIPAGDYSNKYLVVNMANGDVVNNGVFKSISIYAIKDTTFYENTKGNTIHLFDKVARFVVTAQASVKTLNFSKDDAIINLIANGSIDKLNINGVGSDINVVANSVIKTFAVNASSNLTIAGKSKEVAVSVNAPEVKITNNASATISVVTGDVTSEVKTGETVTASKEGVEVPTVTPTPTTAPSTGGGGTGGGGTGGGTTPTPTPITTTVKADANGKYTLPVAVSQLNKVVVKIEGVKDYTVNSTVLSYVNGLLDAEDFNIKLWHGYKGTVKQTLEGKSITIEGEEGATKTVTFDGNSYTVTVNENKSITLKKVDGTYTYTLSKEGTKVLSIQCDNKERVKLVSFVVTY